jgi:hypothetical protein
MVAEQIMLFKPLHLLQELQNSLQSSTVFTQLQLNHMTERLGPNYAFC